MRTDSDHSLYVPGGLRLDDEIHGIPAQNLVLRCCGYLPRNGAWNFLQVFSPFWRLYYNFCEGHHIEHGGRTFPLMPTHVLLIPESTLFHCASPGDFCGHLYIHFCLPPGHTTSLNTPLRFEADTVTLSMIRNLTKAITSTSIRKSTQLSLALLYWVLGKLPEETEIFRQSSAPLQKAMRFIQEHPGNHFSNSILAAVAGVSVRSLVRLFEKEIHLSAQAHVREVRLRQAARLLAYGADTIDSIAEDLGFPNRSYFTRQFTKRFGYSPGAFRKRVVIKNNEKKTDTELHPKSETPQLR